MKTIVSYKEFRNIKIRNIALYILLFILLSSILIVCIFYKNDWVGVLSLFFLTITLMNIALNIKEMNEKEYFEYVIKTKKYNKDFTELKEKARLS